MRRLLLPLLLAACANGAQPSGAPTPSVQEIGDARTAAPTPTSPDATLTTPQKVPSMSDFQTARQHFVTAAAQRLQKPESELTVRPSDPTATNPSTDAVRTGRLQAFEAQAGTDRWRALVAADGTIVTADGDLDLLFREAAALADPPGLSAPEIAERIVWLHGMGHRLVKSAADFGNAIEPPGAVAPSLEKRADGSAVLRFFLLYSKPRSSGSSATYECVAQIAPSYDVTFTKTKR